MVSVSKALITVIMAVGPALAFSGDMTYYYPGLGSCGWTNGNNDAVVALSPSKSGDCGKTINIHYQGKSTTAKVVDKCPGCAADAIDVSPTVFSKLANLDQGRVSVTWEFI
ncbi:riboflavine-aldehyde-forming enzyme [Xylaria cubensis]|nr:riboflavine-aldehyde-forming enzyme [Xylaria cubensis]